LSERSIFVVISSMVAVSKPLSNLQLELLKLYATSIPEHQLQDIKKLLAAYFAEMVDREMESFWQENGLDDSTLDKWKKERLRTTYRTQ
jgi:hypothetical protein